MLKKLSGIIAWVTGSSVPRQSPIPSHSSGQNHPRGRSQDRARSPVSKDHPSPTPIPIPTRAPRRMGCTRPLASVIAPPSASPYSPPPDSATSTSPHPGLVTQRTIPPRRLAESESASYVLCCISVRARGRGSTHPGSAMNLWSMQPQTRPLCA
ncbi:hypothetical protein OG21DRAFT_1252782 [Imleria badia]|nr:hypothetical protein OG21DRAFT_1252782 [Imleria badia]